MYCNLEALALEYIRSLEVCPDFRWQEHFPLPPNLRPRPTFVLADHVGFGSKFYGCWGSVNLKAPPYPTTILNHPAVFHLRTPSSKQIRWTTVINGKDEWLRLGVRWWIMICYRKDQHLQKNTNCWTRYQISRRCHMWFIFSIWFQNDFGKLEQHIRTRYFPQKVFSLTREFTGVFPGFCLRLVRGPTSLKIQLVLQQKALVWMVLTSGYTTCWYKHIYIYIYYTYTYYTWNI